MREGIEADLAVATNSCPHIFGHGKLGLVSGGYASTLVTLRPGEIFVALPGTAVQSYDLGSNWVIH